PSGESTGRSKMPNGGAGMVSRRVPVLSPIPRRIQAPTPAATRAKQAAAIHGLPARLATAAGNLRRAVRRGVIDYQDLVDRIEKIPDHVSNGLFLVVCWDHDAHALFCESSFADFEIRVIEIIDGIDVEILP